MKSILHGGWAILLLASASAAQAESQEERDQAFQKQMDGVALVGSWTVASDATKQVREERYEIASVAKQENGLWLFKARIVYGKHDLTVPLLLRVEWAGDTPVITLTDFTIPGMGTFTSRVLIFRDRYAGTWQHDAVGGHLWGRVEKLAKAAEPLGQ